MQNIHFINKRIGGVGIISDRLEFQGEKICELNFLKLIGEIRDDSGSTIYFHQPKSHLYCALVSFLYPHRIKNFRAILHEAANYNSGVAHFIRALIGYLGRRTVISFLKFLNVEILGVSDYVLRTYGILSGKRITYLNLFKQDIENIINKNKPDFDRLKSSTITIWVRSGDGVRVQKILNLMSRGNYFRHVNLLGDKSEVESMKSTIMKTNVPIEINEIAAIISREDFIRKLVESTWFLSMFEKEGFGLSAFEAMAAGCVCLTPRSGAINEWLPAENYILFEKILAGSVIDHDLILKTSNINRAKAKELIS